MPWRNDGVQAHVTWGANNPAGVCHYAHRWRDRYAHRVRSKALRAVLRGRRYGIIVDVGCGDGEWLPLLARHADAVVTTDVATFGDQPQILADAERLPFRDRGADLATLVTVLAHVQGQEQALSEVTRVADEVLVLDYLADPTPPFMLALPHRRVWSQSELDQAMMRRGFELVQVRGCGNVDGSLFVVTPQRWWRTTALVTGMLDRLRPDPGRYRAALYRRAVTSDEAGKGSHARQDDHRHRTRRPRQTAPDSRLDVVLGRHVPESQARSQRVGQHSPLLPRATP